MACVYHNVFVIININDEATDGLPMAVNIVDWGLQSCKSLELYKRFSGYVYLNGKTECNKIKIYLKCNEN